MPVIRPSVGSVVVLNWPFTDATSEKRRPAITLMACEMDDWILCPITTDASRDPSSVGLMAEDFEVGGIRHHSFAKPTRLFTLSATLILQEIGRLNSQKLNHILDNIIRGLEGSRR